MKDVNGKILGNTEVPSLPRRDINTSQSHAAVRRLRMEETERLGNVCIDLGYLEQDLNKIYTKQSFFRN